MRGSDLGNDPALRDYEPPLPPSPTAARSPLSPAGARAWGYGSNLSPSSCGGECGQKSRIILLPSPRRSRGEGPGVRGGLRNSRKLPENRKSALHVCDPWNLRVLSRVYNYVETRFFRLYSYVGLIWTLLYSLALALTLMFYPCFNSHTSVGLDVYTAGPETYEMTVAGSKVLVLQVGPDGDCYFNSRLVKRDELSATLSNELAQRRWRFVYLKISPAVRWQTAVDVVEAVQRTPEVRVALISGNQ